MKAATRGLLFITAALSLCSFSPAEELDFSRLAKLVNEEPAVASVGELDFSRLAKLCEDCDCPAGCECDGACECGSKTIATPKFERAETKELAELKSTINSLIGEINGLKDRINCQPERQVTIELPEQNQQSKLLWSGYPTNNRPRWDRYSGNAKVQPSRSELIQHLQTGEHAGKFNRQWLETLTYEELESLHTDDHEHRLKGHVQTPSTQKTSSVAASPQVAVAINNRTAVYRMEVYTKRVKECHGGVCTYRDVQTVRPVFVRWE